MAFDFDKTVKKIREMTPGRERSLYPYLRDLFVHVLGHDSGNIDTDTPQKGMGGNSPDITICLGTGISDEKGREIRHDWLVGEVKSEAGVFADEERRKIIFDEKAKYIQLGTEWFLMMDPSVLVVRPVALGSQTHIDPGADIVLEWEGVTKEEFLGKLALLKAEHSVSPALRRFREGDESRIAVVVLDLPDEEKAKLSDAESRRLQRARRDFLDAIRESTRLLQVSCEAALREWMPEIANLHQQVEAFSKRWEGYEVCFDPARVQGTRRIESAEEQEEHDQGAQELEAAIKRNPALAKLAMNALPAYYRRSGRKQGDTSAFATESANLVLARILLLRFFEDHQFFGDKRYVCNGGITALQDFMKHHELGYPAVLKAAYRKGADIYADAFDQTDLDWVLGSDNLQTSRTIELAMMYLSRFDFSTVSGDILSGIYDRFLDKSQRKKMGEFYTPPSVARYIIERLGIESGHSVFDPACGSGTFLLEAFNRMTHGDIVKGRGDYAQAAAALAKIGGNDLNPFSAMIARIQILWHLLPLKDDLRERGFPSIRTADGMNSLLYFKAMQRGVGAKIYRKLEETPHDFVIGNPPYVRPERSEDLDGDSEAFYADIGGAKKNLFTLFVYKSLEKWCRPPAEAGGDGGKLGFVVPLSFCDSESNKSLRRLFAVDGRFRLLEIVDLEPVAPLVFDAAVNPILLLAERRPAREEDTVVLRIADQRTVVDAETHEFDLTLSSEEVFRYGDIWTEDGRILTKLSRSRKRLLDKLSAAKGTLEDIAQTFWVGKLGNRIYEWRLTKPDEGELAGGDNGETGRRDLRWEERRMLGMGAAERRQSEMAPDGKGLDFYKGENVTACLVEGTAAKENILPDSLSDSSFWRYRDILPEAGYAFLRISLGITAAHFNPREKAFLNTATLLFPNEEWRDFPLDIALMSRVYQYYYALYLREGTLNSWRSDLYPRTLQRIPFPPALLKKAKDLHRLRGAYLNCRYRLSDRAGTLQKSLMDGNAVSLSVACRECKAGIRWSDFLLEGGQVEIDASATNSLKPVVDGEDYRLFLTEDKQVWLAVGSKDVARRLAAALTAYDGQTLGREGLLKVSVPANEKALSEFVRDVKKRDGGREERTQGKILDDVDKIVGGAFGLSAGEIASIRKEMRSDAFLKNIRPRPPHSASRIRGLLGGLGSSARYLFRAEEE